MLGKLGGEGVTDDEMAGWHHRLRGHEFEQTLQDIEGAIILTIWTFVGKVVSAF